MSFINFFFFFWEYIKMSEISDLTYYKNKQRFDTK